VSEYTVRVAAVVPMEELRSTERLTWKDLGVSVSANFTGGDGQVTKPTLVLVTSVKSWIGVEELEENVNMQLKLGSEATLELKPNPDPYNVTVTPPVRVTEFGTTARTAGAVARVTF